MDFFSILKGIKESIVFQKVYKIICIITGIAKYRTMRERSIKAANGEVPLEIKNIVQKTKRINKKEIAIFRGVYTTLSYSKPI